MQEHDAAGVGAVSALAERIVSQRWFRGAVVAAIVLGGVVVGLEAVPPVAERHAAILDRIDDAVVALFVVEALLKIVAAGTRPMRYFGDPWNLFDFTVTVVCVLPLDGQFAQVLRLARVVRSLRLVRVLPRLQLLVDALLRSLPSFGWITALLMLLLYVYSVMGFALFGENDPARFGNLWTSMLTMFGILTLEGWVDNMQDQMGGIAVEAGGGDQSSPIAAPVFFVSFILMGTMVFLNLLVGVIVNSLSEGAAEQERAAREEAEAKPGARAVERPGAASPRSSLPRLQSPDAGDPAHAPLLAERLARLEASLDSALAELKRVRGGEPKDG
jgi:voltage-gated sodium channel